MAIRYRPKRGKPYVVYWRNPASGKMESVSFAEKEDAEKEDARVRYRLRFERETFEVKEKVDGMPLAQCHLLYMTEKGFSMKGLRWQRDCMREALGMWGATPVGDITTPMLEGLKARLLREHRTAATARAHMSVLRAVLRWAVRKGYRDVVTFPEMPVVHYRQFVPPTEDELAAMLAAAAPHIRRVIVLGCKTGARVGSCELFGLKWSDVDFPARLVRIHGSHKNLGAPWREVPIMEGLVPLLEAWEKEDRAAGIPWLVHYKGAPVHSIKNAWAKMLVRAGITRTIRPYDLRHRYATDLLAAGVDVGTAARLLGHSSPMMLLAHYQYVMDAQKRAAAAALPPLPCMSTLYVREGEGRENRKAARRM